jgi:hypothetical protein
VLFVDLLVKNLGFCPLMGGDWIRFVERCCAIGGRFGGEVCLGIELLEDQHCVLRLWSGDFYDSFIGRCTCDVMTTRFFLFRSVVRNLCAHVVKTLSLSRTILIV